MFSAHSQAQMYPITGAYPEEQHQHLDLFNSVHAATNASTSADFLGSFGSSQLSSCDLDFILDEAFSLDFQILTNATKSTPLSTHSSNNSSQQFICLTSQIESSENRSSGMREDGSLWVENNNSLELLSENLLDGINLDELLDGIDSNGAASTPEAALNQSPSWQFVEQVENLQPFEQGLYFTAESSSLCGQSALNSPSAEITYSNLISGLDVEQSATTAKPSLHNDISIEMVDGTSSLSTRLDDIKDDDDDDDDNEEEDDDDDDDDVSLFSSSDSSVSAGRSKSSCHRRIRSHGTGSVSKVYKSKKESNKAAAERYRSKKQSEKQELFAECLRHEEINKKLKSEIDEVQAELNFIKNLLVEALLTKNASTVKS